MEAARNATTPPPAVMLRRQCEHYRCLPSAGGYLDQDYAMLRDMTALTAVYDAVTAWHSGKQNESQKRTVMWLVEQGYSI